FAVRTQVAVQAAKSGNTSVNEARIQFRKCLVANTHFIQKARAEIFNDDIRLAGQLAKDLAPTIALEIEGQATLVAIETKKIAALRLAFVVLNLRRPPVGRAPPSGTFAFDQIGSLVGKHHGAIRPCHLNLKA